ncbi:MAG: phage antirepressor KilAC domain-containing protein [Aestuariivirga sp.]
MSLSIFSQPAAGGAITMSSREIADLIGSQHGHIKISAERLAGKGVIGTLAVREFTHNGNTYTEYLLDKRDSLVLVAQNCPEFTARIVDRWQELEAQVAKPAFQLPTTFAAALRLAAEQAEQIEQQQAQLAIAAPKVAFVDGYVEATGLKGFREVAKLLKANEARLREFLIDRKIMYRLNGEWVAYQPHIDAGRFEVKTGKSDRSGHAFNRSMFTPKGVEWIAGEWAKRGIQQALSGAEIEPQAGEEAA